MKFTKQALSRVNGFFESRFFYIAILIWFVFQSLWMAVSTKFGISPDEAYHLSLIQLFSQDGIDPFISNQAGFYHLGEVIKSPFFLYHYLLSFPYHLFDSFNQGVSIFLLRLINIFLGLGSLFLTAKICEKLSLGNLTKNLSLFMLANTLMFVFLSSSINYDNLFVLISLATTLALLFLAEKISLMRLQLLIVCILSGLLTKINFIPIAVISFFIFIYLYFQKRSTSNKILIKNIKKMTFIHYLLFFIIALLSLVFVQRYVFNIIEYKNFQPKCTQVLTLEQCRQNGIYFRGEQLNNASPPSAPISNFEYVSTWILLNQERTYGIFGHKVSSGTALITIWAQLLLIGGVLVIARNFSRKDPIGLKILLVISIFYIIILINQNQGTYQSNGNLGLALQGRYLFSVLPILYILSNYYLLRSLKKQVLRVSYSLITFTIFLSAGLPSYIYITNSSWHTKKSIEINKDAKKFLQSIPH